MKIKQKRFEDALTLIRYSAFRYGYTTIISALSGDPIPETNQKDLVLRLRENLCEVFLSLGYWRANVHLLGPDYHFNPWRPWQKKRDENTGLLLPFVDLGRRVFRPYKDRREIERSAGWYHKIEGDQADSSSFRSLEWLESRSLEWLESWPMGVTDPIITIDSAEILTVLLLLSPRLLPLRELVPPDIPLTTDGNYALQYGSPKSFKEVIRIAARWLSLKVPSYSPDGFRESFLSLMPERTRAGLIELLHSIRIGASAEDLIYKIEQASVYQEARSHLQGESSSQDVGIPKGDSLKSEVCRFNPTEPITSGTRSLVFWPVSSFAPFSDFSSTNEWHSIYCMAALRPGIEPTIKRTKYIRELIETILVQTIPSATSDQIALEIQGTRSRKAFDFINHQVRNIAIAAEMMTYRDDGSKNTGSSLEVSERIIVRLTSLLAILPRGLQAGKAHAEATLQSSKGTWGVFGKNLISALSGKRPLMIPFSLEVEDGEIRDLKPDVRIYAIAWELANNAFKHAISDPSNKVWKLMRKSTATAGLILKRVDNQLIIRCVSEPHSFEKAQGIYTEVGPIGTRIKGVPFIIDLCEDLGHKIDHPKDAWTVEHLQDGYVRVVFSWQVPLSKAFPKEKN